jgi:hypothetical protein
MTMTDEELLKSVEATVQRAHSPVGQTVTTAIAVLGLIVTVAYSWAVQEARITNTAAEVGAVKIKADQVPELRWEISQLKRDIDRLDSRSRSMETKIDQIHEAMIRMGVVVGSKGG